MGLVQMGPPTKLVIRLRDKYNLRDFIETGTYEGATAVWASRHFERVITVECSKEIYQKAVSKYGRVNKINFLLGDSRTVLRTLVPQLTRPAFFWLDAHFSGGETYGKDNECPLIEEIHAINTSGHNHFIFIDDARLFCSPPPRPHRVEQWPSIDEIIRALEPDVHKRYIVMIEDAIIAVPECAKEIVADYCQDANTKAWDEWGKRLEESGIKRGCNLLGQGLRLMSSGFYNQLRRLAISVVNGVMRK